MCQKKIPQWGGGGERKNTRPAGGGKSDRKKSKWVEQNTKKVGGSRRRGKGRPIERKKGKVTRTDVERGRPKSRGIRGTQKRPNEQGRQVN